MNLDLEDVLGGELLTKHRIIDLCLILATRAEHLIGKHGQQND